MLGQREGRGLWVMKQSNYSRITTEISLPLKIHYSCIVRRSAFVFNHALDVSCIFHLIGRHLKHV